MSRKVSHIVQSLLKHRQEEAIHAREAGLTAIPLVVYSYTSRSFPCRISDLFSRLAKDTPALLLSLADLWFNCIDASKTAKGKRHALRFLDSGTFEIRPNLVDPTGRALSSPTPKYDFESWDEYRYLAAARTYAQSGDVLLSYDDLRLPLTEQVETALNLFGEIKNLNLLSDLIVHLEASHNMGAITKVVRPYADEIQLIAIPVDELPGGWARRLKCVRQLRNMLNEISPAQYVYLHVLGCIDPASMTHLFWGGADIFDGVGWLQYYFSEHRAYSFIDFEFQSDGQEHPAKLLEQMARSNIAYLERLRHDLTEAVLNGEAQTFSTTLERVAQTLNGLLE